MKQRRKDFTLCLNLNLPIQFSIKAKAVSLWDSEVHFQHKISKSFQKGNAQTDHSPLRLYYHLKKPKTSITFDPMIVKNKNKLNV